MIWYDDRIYPDSFYSRFGIGPLGNHPENSMRKSHLLGKIDNSLVDLKGFNRTLKGGESWSILRLARDLQKVALRKGFIPGYFREIQLGEIL